jgi:hypothetical protein
LLSIDELLVGSIGHVDLVLLLPNTMLQLPVLPDKISVVGRSAYRRAEDRAMLRLINY